MESQKKGCVQEEIVLCPESVGKEGKYVHFRARGVLNTAGLVRYVRTEWKWKCPK